MKKYVFAALLILVFGTFAFKSSELFTGKIIYKCSYSDLNGNDMSDKLAPYFGKEQRYFMDNKNYKTLNENNNYIQLYTNADNTFYFFTNDKVAYKFDAATKTAENVKVTQLDKKEKIAGYECKSLQVETESSTTVYYYSPQLKTDPRTFSMHNYGEFNKFLEASGGGLPLKIIVTDKNGISMTFEATEVKKMKVAAKEFEFPKGYKIEEGKVTTRARE